MGGGDLRLTLELASGQWVAPPPSLLLGACALNPSCSHSGRTCQGAALSEARGRGLAARVSLETEDVAGRWETPG